MELSQYTPTRRSGRVELSWYIHTRRSGRVWDFKWVGVLCSSGDLNLHMCIVDCDHKL